jgi:molybdopterin-guanine dinucleotide biosynthesis protein A
VPVVRDAESGRPGVLWSVRYAPDTSGLREPLSVSLRTAIIFAGGRATRLGGVNKALLEVGGTSIIARILRALEPLTEEQVLLTNDASLERIGALRLVLDPEPYAGVLPALAAGLAQARGDVCLAVACDMPFVSTTLFARLLELQASTDADVVIARTAGYLEPMHAVYRTRSVIAAIEGALSRGEQRMISYFRDVRVHEVDEPDWRSIDPMGLAFFNVNTPDDLAQARQLVTALDRSEASETA